jgi:hypothetical protein
MASAAWQSIPHGRIEIRLVVKNEGRHCRVHRAANRGDAVMLGHK